MQKRYANEGKQQSDDVLRRISGHEILDRVGQRESSEDTAIEERGAHRNQSLVVFDS